jgi:hypothetical protein
VVLTSYQLIQIRIHQLEDQSQAARRLVVQHCIEPFNLSLKRCDLFNGTFLLTLLQSNDVLMGRQPPQGLNLPEIVDLIDTIESIFHAFYGMVFPILDVLGLEHL